MYSNIIFNRKCSRLPHLLRSMSLLEGQKHPEVGKSIDGISPPQRIRRRPTDILQALASTVGQDYTAPNYRYHDDPFLIPQSNFQKRSFALSAESGRKAAAWIRDQHPELFTIRTWDPPMKKTTPHFNADPHIDVFAPKPMYSENSKVTEEDLEYTIHNALVEDAIQVYKLLCQEKELSEELKLSFLQLLSFYNENQPASEEYLEEKWFGTEMQENHKITWKRGGLADKIFQSIKVKTAEIYCVMIQGKAKYHQGEEAFALAKEAHEKGFRLSTEVYNGVLACVGYVKESNELRKETLVNILTDMNNQGLTPNAGTVAACLSTVSMWGGGQSAWELTLQLVAEFRRLDIQFPLSAYYYLLTIFCKPKSPRVNILNTILSDLEQRDTLQVTDIAGTKFFVEAMTVCNIHLQDFNMAERLHNLLMKGDNYKLLGDSYKESVYYKNYVSAACKHAPFETAMRLVDLLVPNVYVPEMSVMFLLIETMEGASAGSRLANMWHNIVVFAMETQTVLVNRLLDAFDQCYYGEDENVKAKMRSAACDIVKCRDLLAGRNSSDNDRYMRSPYLSATAWATIIGLCTDTPDKADPCWEMAERAVKMLLNHRAEGMPSSLVGLESAAPKAALAGHLSLAAMVLKYLAESGFQEAIAACENTMGAMLNKSSEEVKALLSKPTSEIIQGLHPAAADVLEAYRIATTELASRVPVEEYSSEQLPRGLELK